MTGVLAGILAAALVGGYLRYPHRVFEAGISALRRYGGLKPKTLSVGGIKWHYLEGGVADGVPLVLIHGFAGNKDNWSTYSRVLGSEYRIICPDLVGFGDSERLFDLAYDTGSQADRVHEFLLALGIERAHIGGNSMGGMIALQLVLRHPEMALSLALIDSAGTSSTTPNDFQLSVERGERALVIREPEDIDRLLKLATHKPPRIPARIKAVFFEDAKARETFHDMVFEAIADEAMQGGLDDRLTEITQPVLIMWGREDQIIDVSTTELLSARLPNNRLEILDRTGHVPMMERPKASSKIHAEFLTDVAKDLEPNKPT